MVNFVFMLDLNNAEKGFCDGSDGCFVLFKVSGVRRAGRDRVHENNSGRLRSNRIGRYFSDKADKAGPRGRRIILMRCARQSQS